MDLVFLHPSQCAHLGAITEAGVKPRLVLIFKRPENGEIPEIQATFLCPRRRHCASCGWYIGDLAVVNVGIVQRGLPVEVQRVGVPESTAPAASQALPEPPGV